MRYAHKSGRTATNKRIRPMANNHKVGAQPKRLSRRQLQRLPLAQRQEAVGQMGQLHGNKAIQRYLQRSDEADIAPTLRSGLLANNSALDQVMAGEILLRKGTSQAGAVRLIQMGLTTLHPELELGATGLHGIDGDFGPLTAEAVELFQAESGMQVDGIVGPETLARLDSRLSSAVTEEKADGGDPATHEPTKPGEKERKPIRKGERNFGHGDARHDDEEPSNKRFAANNRVRIFEWSELSGSPQPGVTLREVPWKHQSGLGDWGRTTSDIEVHMAPVVGKDGLYRPVIDKTEMAANIKLKEKAAFKEIAAFKSIYEEFKHGFHNGNEYNFSLAMATEAMSSSSTHPYSDFGTVDGVLFHELLHAVIAKKTAIRALKLTLQRIPEVTADEPGGLFEQVMDIVDETWLGFKGQDAKSGNDHLEIYRQEALWYIRAYEKSFGASL